MTDLIKDVIKDVKTGKTTEKRFSLGLDYGTCSVRALIVDVEEGSSVAESEYRYPHGQDGILGDASDPLLARQHPRDYLDGLVASVREVVEQGTANGFSPDLLGGIGVDTTGSTPVPVTGTGEPVAFLPAFCDDLAAMAWLWKDHTSSAEAAEITAKAGDSRYGYLKKYGGTYSSEWFWSKMLHCARTSPKVAGVTASWVELADFIPGWLTGCLQPDRLVRSVCAAGHKALYHPEWGGWPSVEFLESLDSRLVPWRNIMRLPQTSDRKAGVLAASVAARLGLPAGIPVATGGFDAHFGAVGCGIVPGRLVKIIGTSTCDIMVHPLAEPLADIPGLCGIVPHSVLPDYYGLEAGQSAVGDLFNWFVRLAGGTGSSGSVSHEQLTREAARLAPGQSGLVSLDWNNGNRTVLVDPGLSGLVVGCTLRTSPGELYRALIEATAFGALTIMNRLEEYGVPVREVVNCGGIAVKNPLVMQIYADVCNRPMMVCGSSQACALGAAIFGAVAGGLFPDVFTAMNRMAAKNVKTYEPEPGAVSVYRELFELYRTLHDAFGRPEGALAPIMKRLRTLQNGKC